MELADIRERHDRLEGIRGSQSPDLLREKGSAAHRDRGVLLDIVEKNVVELALLRQELQREKARTSGFTAEVARLVERCASAEKRLERMESESSHYQA